MSIALKLGFRSLATPKLVVNVGEHQTEMNGIARFPCDSRGSLYTVPNVTVIQGVF